MHGMKTGKFPFDFHGHQYSEGPGFESCCQAFQESPCKPDAKPEV